MNNLSGLVKTHLEITRRHFLLLGTVGATALGRATVQAHADDAATNEALARTIEALDYFTPPDKFGTVERGTPLPYTHPIEKLREVGMTRETWRLEVVSDLDNPAMIENPLSRQKGNALDWDGLMKLAETKAVRFLKIMTCNNGGSPLGMGLWEGVPLREVVWMTKPSGNLRRLFYHGYHNDDPKQVFRSSLPIGRVLEDSPGEHPVILCYKLNGEYLSGKRGGPVRMLVPDAYGFKSVKWLQKIVLTNAPFANDTYADGNNDVDSQMKTFARFVSHPVKAVEGDPIPITGMAQVGMSGLSQVQYWLHPKGGDWPKDDPHFAKAPWRNADLLPAPSRWKTLPDGKLLGPVLGFDPMTNCPLVWPMRNTLAHWAVLLTDIQAGDYDLRCRTVDASGVAQPMPRPFPKSGRNFIQQVSLTVSEK